MHRTVTLLALVLSVGLAPAAAQETFVVNTTADPGDGVCDAAECTLREAITAANATAERDSIHFAIPGPGVHTIAPTTELPRTAQRVVIDGYTQPGASANTLAVGNDAVLLIELDASAVTTGFVLGPTGPDTTVLRGLVISGAQNYGVITDGTSIVIQGCFIGTDATGTLARGNRGGLLVSWTGSSNITIGGSDPADRNVISGNGDFGGVITSGNPSLPPPADIQIQGNYIGTDASGVVALGNAQDGIQVFHGLNVLIGGIQPGAGNVVAANARAGLGLSANGNSGTTVLNITVQGNRIGVGADGVTPLGNENHGITFNLFGGHLVGGDVAEAGNVIAYNGGAGIYGTEFHNSRIAGNTFRMNEEDGVSLRRFGGSVSGIHLSANAFVANGSQAIDLWCNGDPDPDGGGRTPNDPGDADEGPNRCQNHPEIVDTSIDGAGDLLVTYRVDTDPANAAYPLTVEFFRADAADQGEVYLATDTYTEDDWSGGGTAPGVKEANLGDAAGLGVTEGDPLVQTAADAEGNTSEFSATQPVGTPAEDEAAPVAFVLEPIRPNPFHGEATIGFALGAAAEVRLEVLDALGRHVATLADGSLPAGRHEAVFAPGPLPSGVYLVRLTTAGGFDRTRRLTHLR